MESKCKIGQVLVSGSTHARIAAIAGGDIVIDATAGFEIVKGYDAPVRTHVVRVSEMEITKNPDAQRPAEFHPYRTLERGVAPPPAVPTAGGSRQPGDGPAPASA